MQASITLLFCYFFTSSSAIILDSIENKMTSILGIYKSHLKPAAYVLFQGDSITDGGRDRRRKVKYLTYGQGYPYIIAAKLQASLPEMKYRFSNHGISGNNLYDILARWNWDTMALKPDYISLLIGVNDIWQSHDRNEILKFNYTSFELTYLSMIELARKQLPNTKLILCEPFILQGEHTTSSWDTWHTAIKKLQTVIKSIAEKYSHIIHVAFQDALNDAAKRYPDTSHWLVDGVHPSAPGHQVLADAWLATVASALAKEPKPS